MCLSGISRREAARVRGQGADVRSAPFGGTDRLRSGRRLGRGRRVRHSSAPPLHESEIEAADGDNALAIGRGRRPVAHPSTAERGRGVSEKGAPVRCDGCLALDARVSEEVELPDLIGRDEELLVRRAIDRIHARPVRTVPEDALAVVAEGHRRTDPGQVSVESTHGDGLT